MNSKKIFALSMFFLSVLLFSACRKSDRSNDKDTSAAIDNSSAENVFAGVFKSLNEYTDSASQVSVATCASYTYSPVVFDTTTWPKTLTINFGTADCYCIDGNYRRGTITAVYTGPYRKPGTVITITLNNYYHNGNLVQVGIHTIKNNGYNAQGHLSFSINVQNASVTNANGGVIRWNSSRTRLWIAGENTYQDLLDDVYLISGTATGTGTTGNTFDVLINSPLKVALNCRWVESGSLTLSPQNLSPRTIDFGGGGCDDKATVNISGTVYDIVL